jgi:Na+-driven multidrug efflux pump
MDGVYAGFIIAWVLEVILNAVIFFTGKWKTKEIREIEAEEKQSYSRNANEIPV